jgi:hypothetical protein
MLAPMSGYGLYIGHHPFGNALSMSKAAAMTMPHAMNPNVSPGHCSVKIRCEVSMCIGPRRKEKQRMQRQ